MKFYIDCPYSEKDEAKSYGARWDGTERKWYYEADEIDHNFDKWQGARPSPAPQEKNVKDERVIFINPNVNTYTSAGLKKFTKQLIEQNCEFCDMSEGEKNIKVGIPCIDHMSKNDDVAIKIFGKKVNACIRGFSQESGNTFIHIQSCDITIDKIKSIMVTGSKKWNADVLYTPAGTQLSYILFEEDNFGTLLGKINVNDLQVISNLSLAEKLKSRKAEMER